MKSAHVLSRSTYSLTKYFNEQPEAPRRCSENLDLCKTSKWLKRLYNQGRQRRGRRMNAVESGWRKPKSLHTGEQMYHGHWLLGMACCTGARSRPLSQGTCNRPRSGQWSLRALQHLALFIPDKTIYVTCSLWFRTTKHLSKFLKP